MREAKGRAMRDAVAITAVLSGSLTVLLAVQASIPQQYSDNVRFGTVPFVSPVLDTLRHGMDGVVAGNRFGGAGGNFWYGAGGSVGSDGTRGVVCARVRVEADEWLGTGDSDVTNEAASGVAREWLDAGARAVLLSEEWSLAHLDFPGDGAGAPTVVETSSLAVLLRSERRVLGQEHLYNPDGVIERDAVPAFDLSWPAVPRPPGALAPTESVPTLETVPRVPLVVELPDGTLRPSSVLALWMLTEGVDGPLEVTADEVRVGDVALPAAHGWLELLPPSAFAFLPSPMAPRLSPLCLAADGDGLSDQARSRMDQPGTADPAGQVVLLLPSGFVLDDTTVSEAATLLLGLDLLRTGDRPRDGSIPVTILLTMIATLGVALVARESSRLIARGVLAATAVGLVVAAAATYELGPAYNVFPILLGTTLAYVVASRRGRLADLRRTGELERLVTQYVPRELTGDLLLHGGETMTTGEREATVVFCDLRGFTPIAAELAPTDVQRLLEIFYRHVGERVRAAGGTLVQYVGDEVFSTFGPPATIDDHADRALQCAIALRDDLEVFRAAVREAGLPPAPYGVGLHTGRILTAEVGDQGHRQYSVIGDAVNIGSRLTAAAGAGEVFFSGDLLSRVTSSPDSEQLLEVKLKGVERPLQVYRLS